MKPKSLLLLIVAGGCGLVAALAVTQHLAGRQVASAATPAEPRKAMVIATADYEAGTQLKPDMLQTIEVIETQIPQGAVSDSAELTGQTLRYPVFKGEPVLTGKLRERTLAELAAKLPEGQKACTVRVAEEDSGMQGLINPGDHVDVMWLPNRTDLQLSSVRILLQNVEVMAVGLRVDASEINPKDAKDTKAPDTYTLKLSLEQSRRLSAAMNMGGKIRLALRGRNDTTTEDVDEESLDIALGLKAKPPEEPEPVVEVVAAPEPQKYEIEIIHGNRSTVEVFEAPEEN